MSLIDKFKKEYVLKGVGTPEYYLGGNVESDLDGHWEKMNCTTALSAKTYIKKAVSRFESMFERQLSKENLLMSPSDHPELDDSPLCTPAQASKYRSLIGSANWIITLGRFDISFAVQKNILGL